MLRPALPNPERRPSRPLDKNGRDFIMRVLPSSAHFQEEDDDTKIGASPIINGRIDLGGVIGHDLKTKSQPRALPIVG